MGKIITFINNKGGSGKTTSCFNIACGLKLKGKKILCIDFDAQANLTCSFGIKIKDYIGKNINNVLKREKSIQDVIIKTRQDIDLVSSDLSLSFTELELFGSTMREQILKQALEPIKDNYDYILIDNGPSLLILAQNSLCAATDVYIPTEAEYYALIGATNLIGYINKIAFEDKLNPNLKISGAFITNFSARRQISKDAEDNYNLLFKDILFKTKIRSNVALISSPSAGQSIFEFDKSSNGAKDYEALVDEILERG